MKVFVSYVITVPGGMHEHHEYGDRVFSIGGLLNDRAVEELRRKVAESSMSVRDQQARVSLQCICPLVQ